MRLAPIYFPTLTQARYDAGQWGEVKPGHTNLAFFSPEQKARIAEAITRIGETVLEKSRVGVEERSKRLQLRTREREAQIESETQAGIFANESRRKATILGGIVVGGLILFLVLR